MNMKPGDAFILGGRTHLVVAVTTVTVSVQSPDGVITEYTREKLTEFLCGPVPRPSPYQSPEELAKLIEAIRDIQRKEKDCYDLSRQPGYYPMSPYESEPRRTREYERLVEDYVRNIRKKEKPEW